MNWFDEDNIILLYQRNKQLTDIINNYKSDLNLNRLIYKILKLYNKEMTEDSIRNILFNNNLDIHILDIRNALWTIKKSGYISLRKETCNKSYYMCNISYIYYWKAIK